jgi:PAS domain S-box-containing protein
MKKFSIFQRIRDLKIRTKLLLVYAVLLVITVTFGSLAVYLVVRGNIRQSMENELVNTTEALRNMVRAAATTAVKTHLRGIAEERLHDVEHMYLLVEEQKHTEAEARARISKMLRADVIGKTGYIFVWDVSRAPESIPLVVHPYIQGEDVAYVDFVQKAARLKNGYIEYDWKNPHEIDVRKKSMHIAYFEPWDWVLAAASYREEFLDLVDIDDFQDFIAPLKFGESGYSFIFDIKGNSVLHPFAAGNIYDSRDGSDRYFIREMCEKRNGIITYSLQNTGEMPRQKLTAYRYIPEYEWIVASSSYLDEIYAPLKKLGFIILATALLSMAIMLPLMLWVSSLLTRQLTRLVKGFARGSSGDLSVRIEPRTTDEIGQLTRYFNAFMEKLEKYHTSLRNEMNEKTRTAARLETFGKFAQAAGQGFFMTDLDGRITYANPAMCVITGWAAPEELMGKSIFDFYKNSFKDILDKEIRPVLKRKNTWSGELVLKTYSGRNIDVIQNIFLIRDNLGTARLFATVLTDITERKHTENIIKGQKERIQKQYAQLASRNQELVSTHKRLLESNLALSREKELIAITLRSIADGVITTDAHGRVILMNRTAEIITGIEPDNVAGKNVNELLELVSEKDGAVLENPAVMALKTGAVANPGVDALIVDGEGSPRYVVATAAPVYDAEKTLSGTVLVIRDVTERRKMEKELIKTMKIESLGVFAGGLAHDFNNLLMAVMGNISMANRLARDDEKLTAILNDALNASLSARELTQQLLTFSRGGEPLISLESLGELVVRATDFIMSGSDVQVNYDIPDNLWSGMVDRGQFNQVIIQYCS